MSWTLGRYGHWPDKCSVPTNPTGVEIDHDRQIEPAYARPDVDNIRHPGFFRRIDMELPIQRVVDSQRRLAAIMARPALVANLRLDTSQFGQPCHPVRTTRLALIGKIVMQFVALCGASLACRSAHGGFF